MPTRQPAAALKPQPPPAQAPAAAVNQPPPLHQQGAWEEKAGDGEFADIDADELAAETRSRTLRLRLQGQQNAIRALETQLAEALAHLEARNAQLAVATSKLSVLQPAAQEMRRKVQAANADQQEKVALRRDELLEKYRSQVELMQARLGEERAARIKDAERFKLMRDYNERAKVRTKELEARAAELTAALAECHSKLQRYRKDYKEAAAEVQGASFDYPFTVQRSMLFVSHQVVPPRSTISLPSLQALRGAVNDRDAEITRQRGRCDKAEAALRNANMDIERYREEARAQRLELHAAEDRARKAALDVELMRQRDVTRRAEIRLAGMGRRASSIPDKGRGAGEADGGWERGRGEHRGSTAAPPAAARGGGERSLSLPPPASASAPVSVATVEAELDREVLAESLQHAARAKKPHWIKPNSAQAGGASLASNSVSHGGGGLGRVSPRAFPLPSSFAGYDESAMRSSNSSITSAPSLSSTRELTRIGLKYGLSAIEGPSQPPPRSATAPAPAPLKPTRSPPRSSSSFSSTAALPLPAARQSNNPFEVALAQEQHKEQGRRMGTPDSPDGSATTRRTAASTSLDRSVGSVESLVKARYERLQAMYDRVVQPTKEDFSDDDSD